MPATPPAVHDDSAAPVRSAPARRQQARAFWLNVHLYLALSVGAVIALLALTGSLLVFYPSINQVLNPELTVAPTAAPHVSADGVLATVKSRFRPRPTLMWMPHAQNAAYVVELLDEQNEAEPYHVVTVDAASGKVVDARVWGTTFVTFLFDLHVTLLMGEPGVTVVGCLSILFIISILSGLYLWWPRRGAVARAFKLRPTRQPVPLNFELHRITGLYLSVVLLIIAVAGTSFAFPQLLSAPVDVFAHVTPEPEVVPSAAAPADAQPIGIEAVRRAAHAFAPGSRIASIGLPHTRSDSYSVRYVDRGEPANQYGRSSVWIDQFTGAVLQSHAYSQLGAADRYLALQLPLHNGEILGLPGRWLAFFAGLATVGLYGTGLYLWWKRRRARRA